MLSQGTSCKPRDRDGAGTAPVLFECTEAVRSLSCQQVAVALDVSGLPLRRGMSAEEIGRVAAVGVARFGLDRVKARSARICALNLRLIDGLVSPRVHKARERELWTSARRHRLAIGLGWAYHQRDVIAAFRAHRPVADDSSPVADPAVGGSVVA